MVRFRQAMLDAVDLAPNLGPRAAVKSWLHRAAGIAGRPMKRRRHLVADCAVRAHLVVVSTPSLACSPRLVETEN